MWLAPPLVTAPAAPSITRVSTRRALRACWPPPHVPDADVEFGIDVRERIAAVGNHTVELSSTVTACNDDTRRSTQCHTAGYPWASFVPADACPDGHLRANEVRRKSRRKAAIRRPSERSGMRREEARSLTACMNTLWPKEKQSLTTCVS